MIRRERAAVILYKLVPLLILHLATLPLGRYSLPFRLRPSRFPCCFDVRQSSALIFRGFLSRTVSLAGREIRCLLPRRRSSQRTPISCSFRAVPYVLHARNLLPSLNLAIQANVRRKSESCHFLKGASARLSLAYC